MLNKISALRISFSRIITPCFIIGCAFFSCAATNDVEDLGTITVTASPIVQDETVTADGCEQTLLTRAQLDALNAQDLQTALRQVPGVTVSRYGPIGSYGGGQGGSVYLRGAGTARPGGEVRVYTDGIPRESGVWSHPLMDAVPVDFADSVTVFKSPHPGYASSCFGAIDIETHRRRVDGCEGEMNLAYGRYGTFFSSFFAAAKTNASDAAAGVSYRQSQGVRSHNHSRLTGASARSGVDLSATERIDLTYQHTDSSVEDPGEIGTAPPLRDTFGLRTDAYGLRFSTDRDGVRGFSLVYFEHGVIDWHKDHLTDGVATSPAGYADTTWLNWGTRHRYDVNPWNDLWITGALDVSDEGGHTQNVRESDGKRLFGFKGRFVTVAPYLGTRYDFPLGDDWRLTPSIGTRAYLHSHYGNESAPTAALKLQGHDIVEFAVSGVRGVHYPGIYTRAVSDDFAADTLGAETMNTVMGSAKLKAHETADFTFTVFHTDVQNRIDKTATGYINAGNQRASGVEISSHWNPIESLAFFGSATFTSPETDNPSRLPRWTFTAGATWKICEYLKFSLDGQYVGSMYAYSVRSSATVADLRRLDDALLVNARLATPLESFTPLKGEIYLSSENILDENYECYPGYPMGGTMAYLGCRIKF